MSALVRITLLVVPLVLLHLSPGPAGAASAQRSRRQPSCASADSADDIIGSAATGAVIAVHLDHVSVYEESLFAPKSDILKFRYTSQLLADPSGERFALIEGATVYLYRFEGYQRLAKSKVKGMGAVRLGPWRWIAGTDEVVFSGAKVVKKGAFGMEDKVAPAIIRINVATGEMSVASVANQSRRWSHAVDPQGRRVAHGYESGEIEILSATDGSKLASYTVHEGTVGGLAFHPTRDLLASSGWDGRVVFFDLAQHKEESGFRAGMSASFLQFASQGENLLLGDLNQVSLYDLRGNALETVYAGNNRSFYSFFYSDGLGRVLTSSSESICVVGFDAWAKPLKRADLSSEQQRILEVSDLRKEERIEEALALVDEIVEEFPESGNVRNLYASIYLLDLEEPERALEAALAQKRDLPRHSGGYYWAGRAYEAMGRYAECGDVLAEYSGVSKASANVVRETNCYFRAGQLDRAVAALERRQALSHDQSRAGYSFEELAGWYLWLQGRIAKQDLFRQLEAELRAQVAHPDEQERLAAMVKCRILSVPECVELLEEAGRAADGELLDIAGKTQAALVVEPHFDEARPAPDISLPGQQAIPMAQGLAEVWQILDSLPSSEELPPVGGRFLSEEMLAVQKINPSLVQPLEIKVNDQGQFSFGAAWVSPGGEIDTSYRPGNYFSATYVHDGALCLLSLNFEPSGVMASVQEYRPDGQDLRWSTTNWTEYGGELYRSRTEMRYKRVD
jgi:tetratricopeptide (TPR) repeat protein